MSVALNACAWRDFRDGLRLAKAHARHSLSEPHARKAAIAEILTRYFETNPGVHGSGYAAAPTGFGSVRWHYRCPRCERRVQRLFRPVGAKGWSCRHCSGVGRIRRDRGRHWGEQLLPLVQELEGYRSRRGRRPRRYHRAVRALSWIVVAGQCALA